MSSNLRRPRVPQAALLGLARSGLLRPYRPDWLIRIGWGVLRYGVGPGFGPLAGAIFFPDRTAIVDDDGPVTFGQLETRCNSVATGLTARLSRGDSLALLGSNSTGFYETIVGAARCGLNVLYLNTGFSSDQIAEIVKRWNAAALIYDAEFAELVPPGIKSWSMTGGEPIDIEQIADRAVRSRSRLAGLHLRRSRHIMLTSGTTGQPKSVSRMGGDITSIIALTSGLPNRARETWLVAVPMFHAWGWLNTMLTMVFSSTLVLAHDFDPERSLALVERERCQILIAVPTMLRRIMNLSPAVRRRYDTSSLRAVTVSGSPLTPSLADEFMNDFGDILYSFYGSTEAGYVAVATPNDLRAAPGTVGRPLALVDVHVLDEQGRSCGPGEPGMIWVRSRDSFAGRGAGQKAVAEPLDRGSVCTGDIGWFDYAGRLFISGRADNMIISGGENVYPDEVESVLERHPDVLEAAVVGSHDEDFGQILIAHLVLREGRILASEEMRAWCREWLASFQVPKRFTIHESLPHSATGKVIKRALEEGK